MSNIFLVLMMLVLSGTCFGVTKKSRKLHKRTRQTSKYCLSEAIYYEARNQPELGKIAVAFVVKNRSIQEHQNICSIISEKNQFSWYSDKELRSARKEWKAWKQSQLLASRILENQPQDPTKGATAFASRATPRRVLGRNCRRTLIVGAHAFYTRHQ